MHQCSRRGDGLKCSFVEDKHMEFENKEEGDIKDDSRIFGLSKGKMKKQ